MRTFMCDDNSRFWIVMPCCSPKCLKWTIFSFGIFFAILGICIAIFWKDAIEIIKDQELNVGSDDTTEYKFWKVTPIPMYLEFYLFNWSNWQDVVDSNWTKNPSFVEMGPYTFAEKHYRKQVVFNHNHTVSYKTQRLWHYVPEMSSGTLDDEITTINTILATIGSIVKNKHDIVKMGVNFFLEEKRINLTVTKPAREFLFDGYDDPLLELLKKLHLRSLDIPFTKFGWFVERNGSVDYDGVFNMFDGSDDINKLGRITSWNYENRTKYYPGQCGEVVGTSGELWYPIGDSNSVQVFASDICSTVTLYHDGEEERFGIKGHRYVGDERLLDNGTKYTDMACFSPGEVLPSGVRNVSECKFHAPAFVSYPHFYLADPYYRNQVDGMHPDKTKHQFHVAIEPETGIPLEANAALQLNIRIQKINRIKLLEKVKEHFIPAMWFRQYANLNEELAHQAKLIIILPAVGEYTGYGLIGLGSLLLLVFGVIVVRSQWKGSEEECLLAQETN